MSHTKEMNSLLKRSRVTTPNTCWACLRVNLRCEDRKITYFEAPVREHYCRPNQITVRGENYEN